MGRRVIPFPTGGGRNASPRQPSFPSGAIGDRAYALVFIAVVAAYLYFIGVAETFNLLSGLVLVYWVFVHHEIYRTAYFQKNWGLLLLVLILYAILSPVNSSVIGVLALLYWLFVLRSGRQASSFLRYYLLADLLVGIVTTLLACLLGSVLLLVASIAGFLSAMMIKAIVMTALAWLAMIAIVVMGVFSLFLVVNVLLGRTPRLPFVSAQITYWS